MSSTAKLTLASSIVFSVTVIGYVYWRQDVDRKKLKKGLAYDLERQARKTRNQKALQDQEDLTKALKKQKKYADEMEKIKSTNRP